jgi:hypothetical protein
MLMLMIDAPRPMYVWGVRASASFFSSSCCHAGNAARTQQQEKQGTGSEEATEPRAAINKNGAKGIN